MVETNEDRQEVAHFNAHASRWWDPQGEFRTLHHINPARLSYISQRVGSLAGKRVVDVGCGGGVLSEAMAGQGAQATGIDLGEDLLAIARLHLLESGRQVEYLHCGAEQLAREQAGSFDAVTCLELLEHVPDPAAVVQSCTELVRPGGDVIFSTVNRNLKSFLFAIVGAEFIMNLLPRGTHDYAKFIRPSELDSWARRAGLTLLDTTGLHYNPATQDARLGGDLNINYLAHFRRPATNA